jgi:hypothetical protein
MLFRGMLFLSFFGQNDQKQNNISFSKNVTIEQTLE